MSKVIKKQRDIEKSTLNTIDKSKKIEKEAERLLFLRLYVCSAKGSLV